METGSYTAFVIFIFILSPVLGYTMSWDTPVRVHGGTSTVSLYEGGRSPSEGGLWRWQSVTRILGIVTCCLLAFTGIKLLSSIGVLCFSFLNVAIQTLTIKTMMKVENAMGIMMAEIQRIKNKSLDVGNARLN